LLGRPRILLLYRAAFLSQQIGSIKILFLGDKLLKKKWRFFLFALTVLATKGLL
jgi:hypothetical protein